MADRKLISLFTKAKLVPVIYDNGLMHNVKEAYGTIPTFFNMECYNNPIGIEIEAEEYKGMAWDNFFWRTTEDGSLKKNGVEFISMPLSREMIDYALFEAERATKKLEFGHRTSVHVHVNVSHYTLFQLNVLTALYAMYEGCFFYLVDERRRGNSFCYSIIGTEPKLKWYDSNEEESGCPTTKYCAYNISPVKRQMSVEFRHLHGTGDPKTLRRWIQLCAKLVYYCGKLEPKTSIQFIKEAISTKKVEAELVEEIFGGTSVILPRDIVSKSCRKGELWAMSLLTGVS